jgi:methylthioribose-1-phosphate isomerase
LDGIRDIPIEIRSEDEVKRMRGLNKRGELEEFQIIQRESPALNYSFDVTPARLITGLLTE